MATNYELLEAEWTTKINAAYTAGSITLDAKYEALIALDTWIEGLEQLKNATTTDLQSYSIAGRSGTRRPLTEYHEQVNRAKADLMRMLYGLVTLADFRSDEEVQTST